MGYPMAINLRKRMEKDKTLFVCDVSEDAVARFRQEMEGQGPIEVVNTGCDAAKAAVGHSSPYRTAVIDPTAADKRGRTLYFPCYQTALPSRKSTLIPLPES